MGVTFPLPIQLYLPLVYMTLSNAHCPSVHPRPKEPKGILK